MFGIHTAIGGTGGVALHLRKWLNIILIFAIRRGGDVQPPKTNIFGSTKSGAGMTAAVTGTEENPGSKLKAAATGKVKPGSKADKRRRALQDNRSK